MIKNQWKTYVISKTKKLVITGLLNDRYRVEVRELNEEHFNPPRWIVVERVEFRGLNSFEEAAQAWWKTQLTQQREHAND